jgi:hypothetical protein
MQNVYHNSYLIANKHQLRKFIFVFGSYVPVSYIFVYITMDE